MNKKELNESIDTFVQLKSSIDLEPSETRRIELYEELQIIKDVILDECKNNKIVYVIVRLIQNGLI